MFALERLNIQNNDINFSNSPPLFVSRSFVHGNQMLMSFNGERRWKTMGAKPYTKDSTGSPCGSASRSDSERISLTFPSYFCIGFISLFPSLSIYTYIISYYPEIVQSTISSYLGQHARSLTHKGDRVGVCSPESMNSN